MLRTFSEARPGLLERLGAVGVVAVGQGEALPQGNREEELERPPRLPVVRENGLQVALRGSRIASAERESGPLPERGEIAVHFSER
ncbi:MAG: hypothetical protein IPN83_04965 [Holophagales bacterium]|nr:hypothetical protein [Holophagales bacterium]